MTPASTRRCDEVHLREELTTSIERDGFATVNDVLGGEAVADLALTCDEIVDHHVAGGGRECGVRNLLSWPEVAALAQSAALRSLVAPVLGPQARVTRGILFDKKDGANWGVLWHQDLSLAVAERIDLLGWGPWSLKDGVKHVQPPVAVLERMLTLRVHIDACADDNGPLKVVRGSHRMGRLGAREITVLRERSGSHSCAATAGSVLMMRPLLVHSSTPAERPARRRVIHLEYVDPSALPDRIRLCDA
jgi:hypothetical protein